MLRFFGQFGTVILLLFGLIGSCSSPKKSLGKQSQDKGPKAPVPPAIEDRPDTSKKLNMSKTDSELEKLLANYPQYFEQIFKNKEEFRVQIMYTKIDRQANNQPIFTDYRFNLNPDNYFYPASTVKMPTALLALQKIQELSVPGLTKYSTMITGADYSGQNEVFNDPTSADGRPSIAHYIKKIFLVSDNDAYNRLYEFLGQEYLNSKLSAMGYTSAQLIHRLERSLSEDENRHTNPVSFYDSSGKLVYEQPAQFNEQPYQKRNDFLGKAYYKGEKLVQGPMDFSKKNRLVLEDLHNMIKSIMFPAAVPENQRFKISEEDLRMVRTWMSQFPGESKYPAYPKTEYWDAYCKFLFAGSEKKDFPQSFRIFNKVGDAYGFLIDAAYVVDFEKKIEFILSATIYCNSDGVLNDSKYDYDSVGLPFMKNLGQVIYQQELKRKRTHIPDLSTFRISYEK